MKATNKYTREDGTVVSVTATFDGLEWVITCDSINANTRTISYGEDLASVDEKQETALAAWNAGKPKFIKA